MWTTLFSASSTGAGFFCRDFLRLFFFDDAVTYNFAIQFNSHLCSAPAWPIPSAIFIYLIMEA